MKRLILCLSILTAGIAAFWPLRYATVRVQGESVARLKALSAQTRAVARTRSQREALEHSVKTRTIRDGQVRFSVELKQAGSTSYIDVSPGRPLPESFQPVFPGGWTELARREGFDLPKGFPINSPVKITWVVRCGKLQYT